jgi:dipeptidyl aminopeptidase/acylaminoacyl peptidase
MISEPRDGTLLWSTDTTGAPARIRLRLNSHLADVSDDVGKEEIISYRGSDGATYHARLFLPARYIAGHRYPLIVWPYPGALMPDSVTWQDKPHTSVFAFMQLHLFAVHGYAVMIPSLPASSDEPRLEMAGFVNPAIDSLVARGIVDSARVGLMGFSHGGIAIYDLLTTSPRFAAAVAMSGVSDLLFYYASIQPGYEMAPFANEWGIAGFRNFEEPPDSAFHKPAWHSLSLGSTPWDNPERWYRNNPIYHFDRISTPLMIIRTDNDPFPMTDGDVAFQCLERLGKRVRYVRYWGEPHSVTSPANTRDMMERMLAWLDLYLQPDDSAAGNSRSSP